MEKEIFDGFYDQLPVKQRRGRGGTYPYVSADDVTNRMNKLFQGNWSSRVTFQDMVEGQIIIRVCVEATDPVTGVVYSHEGFGGHTPSSADEAGNGFKSAYSKALVNAVRRWGVGLFLSDDDRTVSEIRQASPPSQVPAPKKPVPTGTPLPEAPPVPIAPKVNIPSTPVAAKKPVVEETITVKQELPALPKTDRPGENYLNPPPPPPMPVTPAEVTQAVEKVVAGMPKIPPQATTILTETVTSDPPIPTPTTMTSDVDDSISDVQKIAIQSLVDMRGFKYEDMANGALERVPDVNTLTHDEAVLVIQFGNNLYRESKQK